MDIAFNEQKNYLDRLSARRNILAKYLSENIVQNNIKALVLIAAPFNDTPDESLASFRLPKSLKNIHKQAKKNICIYSRDYKVVPVAQAYGYSPHLSNSGTMMFDDRGHFKIEHFPENSRNDQIDITTFPDVLEIRISKMLARQ